MFFRYNNELYIFIYIYIYIDILTLISIHFSMSFPNSYSFTYLNLFEHPPFNIQSLMKVKQTQHIHLIITLGACAFDQKAVPAVKNKGFSWNDY